MQLRLAMREEGGMWNAYVATTGTMDGAILIGSAAIAPLKANPDLKDRFMRLMQDVMADTIKRTTGATATNWTVRQAPVTDRGGKA